MNEDVKYNNWVDIFIMQAKRLPREASKDYNFQGFRTTASITRSEKKEGLYGAMEENLYLYGKLINRHKQNIERAILYSEEQYDEKNNLYFMQGFMKREDLDEGDIIPIFRLEEKYTLIYPHIMPSPVDITKRKTKMEFTAWSQFNIIENQKYYEIINNEDDKNGWRKVNIRK